jgi:hypothetical protein
MVMDADSAGVGESVRETSFDPVTDADIVGKVELLNERLREVDNFKLRERDAPIVDVGESG